MPETPKPDPRIFDHTTNRIIGSAETSAEAAEMELLEHKISFKSLGNALQGEARLFGKSLVDLIVKYKGKKFPAAYIGTGDCD